MPSRSKAQKHLMDAVAHNSSFAAKVGIPQSVGNDFVNADRAAGNNETHAGKPIQHQHLARLPARVGVARAKVEKRRRGTR